LVIPHHGAELANSQTFLKPTWYGVEEVRQTSLRIGYGLYGLAFCPNKIFGFEGETGDAGILEQ